MTVSQIRYSIVFLRFQFYLFYFFKSKEGIQLKQICIFMRCSGILRSYVPNDLSSKKKHRLRHVIFPRSFIQFDLDFRPWFLVVLVVGKCLVQFHLKVEHFKRRWQCCHWGWKLSSKEKADFWPWMTEKTSVSGPKSFSSQRPTVQDQTIEVGEVLGIVFIQISRICGSDINVWADSALLTPLGNWFTSSPPPQPRSPLFPQPSLNEVKGVVSINLTKKHWRDSFYFIVFDQMWFVVIRRPGN